MAKKPLQRRVPRCLEKPLDKKRNALFEPGDTVFISEDGEGLAVSLRQRFLDHQIEATVISSPEELPNRCQGFIFLSSLRDFSNIIEASEMNRLAFRYTQKVAAHFSNPKNKGALILVQDTGGSFGFDFSCDPLKAPIGGLAGLAKTAAQEWEHEKGAIRSIDLDAGYRNSGELADILFDEIQYGQALEVGLPEGRRVVIQCPEIDNDPKDYFPRVDANSVIIASGGARGVTAACLLELAKDTKASFALLGRSPLVEEGAHLRPCKTDAELKKAILEFSKQQGSTISLKDLGARSKSILRSREIRSTLRAFEKLNSKAAYYVCDVCDVEQLFLTCDEVRQELGAITALVHGAGVLADKVIKDKSIDDFDWVYKTKVVGFFALSAATAADNIDTICIFSSVAGRFGNVGQSDYAMANEALNKIAWSERKRRTDCIVKSIAWGPWGGGMVTPALRKMFEARGVSLIDIDAGARQFVKEVQVENDDNVEVVIGATLSASKEKARDSKKKVRLSLSKSAYLKDHSIKGQVVLPMVVGMDVIYQSASDAFEQPDIVIEHLDVKKGVYLFEEKDLELSLIGKRDDQKIAFQLMESVTTFYEAEASPQSKALPSRQNLPPFNPWDGNIYDGKILFHGPAFHFLDTISEPESVTIRASLRKAPSWAKDYALDICAMDAALQLGLICANRCTGGYVVPTSIARFGCSSLERASLVIATKVSHTKTQAVYDFKLLNEKKICLSTLEGVVFKVYEKQKG